MNVAANEPRTIVIGYGNPLRGDDRLGWAVVQRLACFLDPHRFQLGAMHQLMPELAEPLSRADLVLFIDAAANQEPGSIQERELQPSPVLNLMTHHVTPERLLRLSHTLYGRCPVAKLFTIGGEDFGVHENLSPSVDAACDELVLRLRRMLSPETAPAIEPAQEPAEPAAEAPAVEVSISRRVIESASIQAGMAAKDEPAHA